MKLNLPAYFKGVDKGLKQKDPSLLRLRYCFIPPYLGTHDFQVFQAYLYSWRFQN